MTDTKRYLLSHDIVIDVIEQKAYQNNELLKLSDLSFKTLLALIHAHPNYISTDQLADKVWQQTEVSPETITQRIAMIRKTLSENASVGSTESGNALIVSLRNKGYRWTAEVKSTDRYKTFKTPNSRQLFLIITALVIVILVIWQTMTHFTHQEAPTTPSTTSKTSPQVTSHISVDELNEKAWDYLGQHTAASSTIAANLFRKSLEINADQAETLTGLSQALSHQVTKFNQPSSLLKEARQAAIKATELNQLSSQAWATLAFVEDASGNIDLAIEGYEKAIELNPKDLATTSSLAYLYANKGRLAEALKLNLTTLGTKQLYLDLQIAQVLALLNMDILAEQWFEKADTLSPDNVFVTYQWALHYLSNNQIQTATNLINVAIDRGVQRPELPLLQGVILWSKGEHELAAKAIQQAMSIDPEDLQAQVMLLSLELLNHENSNKADQFVEQFLEQLTEGPANWPDQWVFSAQIYTQLGHNQKAIEHLQQAFEAGYRNHRWLQILPGFFQLKKHKAWPQIIEAMQSDVSNQRKIVLNAEWLPEDFLNPSSLH